MKRVYIIHGWDGHPDEGWFPWLKKGLEKRGFHVEIPAMPESAEPKIEAWVSYLSDTVGSVDENTFFVGHSIGCQTILRYFEKLPRSSVVGGAFFVAGWFTLNLKTDEEIKIARPWLSIPIDFEKIKKHTARFFCVFSDDDEDVPISNLELFQKNLGAKCIIEHNKGHFCESDGVMKLPIILHEILAKS